MDNKVFLYWPKQASVQIFVENLIFLFIYNKTMQTNAYQLPKRNKLMTSSTFFNNSHFPNSPNQPFQINNFNFPSRDTVQNVKRQPFTQTRNSISQSMIFTNPNSNGKMVGFSKLDSMARHVSNKPEQRLSVNSSISQNQPFQNNTTKKESNPFASQFIAHKVFSQSNGFQTNYIQQNGRRRRESVGIQTFNRDGLIQENLRFLQRINPQSNTTNTTKQIDCESTNSGSENQPNKPKVFNFTKKRMDKNPTGTPKHISHSIKTQPNWPLSISPVQQKSPFQMKQYLEEPASASKLEYRHHMKTENNFVSNIQFKKKKVSQNGADFKKMVSPTSFSTTMPDFKQNKDFEDIPVLKNRKPKPQRQIGINDFQFLNKLGKGAFGQVFVAQQKHIGFMCVIKKMSKKRIKQAHLQQHIIRQIKLQSYLNHSHCTAFYGYLHDQDYLYLILQLLPDGSLQQVKKKRKLPEKQAADIVRQVAVGLKYMHEEYIIHRDLKPENLFMNDGYVKIGDFGCSICHRQTGLRNTVVGCLQYSSPEQLFKEGYTDKIDSWSIGILTFQILFGKSPFQSDIKNIVKNGQAKQQLSQIVFPQTPVIKQEAKHFITNLLSNNPDLRMDMEQVLNHPFLREQKTK